MCSVEHQIDILLILSVVGRIQLMQSSDIAFITSIRLIILLIILILIYFTTKQSSRAIAKAWRLPIIYPHDSGDSAKKIEERESLLEELSRRWSLFTIIDYSLAVLIAYELIMGFSVEYDIANYFEVHLPSAVAISFGVGSLLAIAVIKLRNPFQSGRIQPLKHLVQILESLANAVHIGDTEVSEDTEDILLRILGKEIERFMKFRKLGEAECGRLLEYLVGIEGSVGRAASTMLWP
jgi:hypothetical protein